MNPPDASSAGVRSERSRRESRPPSRSVTFGSGDKQSDIKSAAPHGKSVVAKLDAPEQSLPIYSYDAEDIETTEAIGSDDDEAESFDDRAPDGGILVGLHVLTGDSFGGNVVELEPIYQVGNEYKSQGLFGTAKKPERGRTRNQSHVLIAPKGHAVGGVQVRSGLLMDAIRLVYMPVNDKQLDTKKIEYSEWVGGDGGGAQEIIGDGSLVVGLGGLFNDDLEMRAVRLHFIESRNVSIAEPSRTAAAIKDTNEFRTWKSTSGKFSLEARLESFDGKQAALVSKAGKKLNVPAEKLSDGDRDFLKNWLEQQAKAEDQPAQEEESPFE